MVDGSAHVLVLKLQRPWNWILVFVINNVFSNCVHFSEFFPQKWLHSETA
jgi:hypothetical protein